ncbi:MAG: glycosyltransferase family 2 protein [Patescibacteria group bacterium]
MSIPKLSIIILSYNTKDLLLNCLRSLEKVKNEVIFEIIVVDNASTDGSLEAIKNLKIENLKILGNEVNLGFARGNNTARTIVRGEYILFLNSDTEVQPETLKKSINYLSQHKDTGVVTVRTLLPSGKLDKDVRRSFPTPFIALTHFSGLDRLFPKSKMLASYWYGYIPDTKSHYIDVAQGAFFMTRKKLLDEVDWFSEEYFLDGEDIDLCWKIKLAGKKIYYFADASILHTKKASKKSRKKIKFVHTGVDSMEIFYRKFMWDNYPLPINLLVISGIKVIKIVRTLKHLII